MTLSTSKATTSRETERKKFPETSTPRRKEINVFSALFKLNISQSKRGTQFFYSIAEVFLTNVYLRACGSLSKCKHWG